jgi:hypothetical protein
VILGLAATCILHAVGKYLTYDLSPHKFPFRFWWWAFWAFYPGLVAFGLSSTIRITTEWIRNERKRKELEAEKLVFRVENTLLPHVDDLVDSGSGIGLKNVSRRLDLLYPGNYELKLSKQDDRYIAELKLNQLP